MCLRKHCRQVDSHHATRYQRTVRAGTQRQVAHCLAAAVVDIVGGPASAAKWTQLGPRAPPDAPDGVAFSGWTPRGPPQAARMGAQARTGGSGWQEQGADSALPPSPGADSGKPGHGEGCAPVGWPDGCAQGSRPHTPSRAEASKLPGRAGGQAGHAAPSTRDVLDAPQTRQLGSHVLVARRRRSEDHSRAGPFCSLSHIAEP